MSATHQEQQLPTKEILRVLFPFLKNCRGHLFATVGLMTVSAIANVFVPMLVKDLIESNPSSQNVSSNAMSADSLEAQQQLRRDLNAAHIKSRAVLLVLTFAVYHAISCWGHLQAYKLGMHMSTAMIKKAVEGLAVVPWEDTIQKNPAEYSQLLVQASRFAGDTVASIVTNMYPNLIGVVGYAVMVLFMSPSLTLLFAFVVVVTQSLQRYRQMRIDMNSAHVGQLEAKTLAVVTNTIQRSALIRLFHCSDFILDKLDICAQKSIDAAANLNFAIHSNAAMGSGTTNCLFVLIVALMLLKRNDSEEAFSTLDIAMFFMIMGQLLNRVVSVVNDINGMNTLLQRTTAFVKLMRRAEANGVIPFFLDDESDKGFFSLGGGNVQQQQRRRRLSAASAAKEKTLPSDNKEGNDIVVSLKNVGFIYSKAAASPSSELVPINGDDSSAENSSISNPQLLSSPTTASSLRNINLDIKRGTFVGIVGASGGGKTTILRIIAGLLRPTSGSVDTFGEDIVMLEQGSSIVVGSVEENIRIGDRYHRIIDGDVNNNNDSGTRDTQSGSNNSTNAVAVSKAIQEAASRSGSIGFINQLPNGFHTLLENIDVSGLSGGQLQRICLARVFLSRANIVLFDEPTTGLDPVSTERFYETAMRLKEEEGRTIILVTHEHQLVAKADVVVAVKAGEIVGQGSYEALKQLLSTLHDH